MRSTRQRCVSFAGMPFHSAAACLAAMGGLLTAVDAAAQSEDLARELRRPAIVHNAFPVIQNAELIEGVDDERKIFRAWEGISTALRPRLDAAVASGWGRLILNRPGNDGDFVVDGAGGFCGRPLDYPQDYWRMDTWVQRLYAERLADWMLSSQSPEGFSVEIYGALDGIMVGGMPPARELRIPARAEDPCGGTAGVLYDTWVPTGLALADMSAPPHLGAIRHFLQPWGSAGARVVWLDHTHNPRSQHTVFDKLAWINVLNDPRGGYRHQALATSLAGAGHPDGRLYVGGEIIPPPRYYDLTGLVASPKGQTDGAASVVDVDLLALVPSVATSHATTFRDAWRAMTQAGRGFGADEMPQMWIQGTGGFLMSPTSADSARLAAVGVELIGGMPDHQPRLVLGRTTSLILQRVAEGTWIYDTSRQAWIDPRKTGNAQIMAYGLKLEDAYRLFRDFGVTPWVAGEVATAWVVRIYAEDFKAGIEARGMGFDPNRLPFDRLDYDANGIVDERDAETFNRRRTTRPAGPRYLSYFWGDYNLDGRINGTDDADFTRDFADRRLPPPLRGLALNGRPPLFWPRTQGPSAFPKASTAEGGAGSLSTAASTIGVRRSGSAR